MTQFRRNGKCLYFLLGLVLTVLPGAAAWAQSEYPARTLPFPEGQPVGEVLVRDAENPGAGWETLAAAQGAVEVPAGKEAVLDVADTGDLGFLAQFPDGALQGARFSELKLEAARLAQVAATPGLRSVEFNEMRVRGELIDALSGCKTLERLAFTRVSIASKDIAVLPNVAGQVSLKTLEFEDCRVLDSMLESIGAITTLETLVLRGTRVTDAGLAHLAGLQHLKKLDLANTAVTDAGMAEIAKLGQLAEFAPPSGVTESGLEQLKGLPAYAALAARKTCLVTVVDKRDGKPLPGAEVKAHCDDNESTLTTDASGQCRIPLAPELEFLSILCKKDGFVPMQGYFRKQSETDVFPEQVRVECEPAVRMGGIVVDESGNPVAGAEVALILSGSQGEEMSPRVRDKFRTDADGRWHCDEMPAEPGRISFKLTHKDFISDAMYGMTEPPPLDALKAETARMVLRSGMVLRGRVVDSAGNPVAHARVLQGEDRWGTDYPQARADKEGVFQFRNVNPGQITLTVLRDGFAPYLEAVDVQRNMEELVITLTPGRTLRARLVDQSGAPISGATVIADGWRNCRTLTWRGKSDAEGRFVWDSAPEDAVQFDILRDGFMDLRGESIKAGDEETTLKMYPPLRVSGRVTDKETGQPVADFQVTKGIDWDNGSAYSWEMNGVVAGKGGQYTFTVDYPYPGHVLRFEGDGYKPHVSRVFKNDEGEQTYDVALEKGTPVAGIILLPDGGPAAGAEVLMALPGQWLRLTDGRLEVDHESLIIKTDAEGRFTFGPQVEQFLIIAVHDRGCIQIAGEELTAATTLTLKPWAKVEGRIRVGAHPGAGEEVVLMREVPYRENAPQIMINYTAKADADGRFVFDRVVDGALRFTRLVHIGDICRYSGGDILVLEPGAVRQVEIGGTGCPVRGRITLPEEGPVISDWNCGDARITRVVPDIDPPETLQTPEEQQKWYDAWMASPEGIEHERQRKSYAVVMAADGSFTADDVPAGDYSLSVDVYQRSVGRNCGWGERIGAARKEFTIPEMAGGRSDEPFDLGDEPLGVIRKIEVGKPVSDFTVKTVDGTPVKLSDYRGKYVLLDFWATWCGPCRGEMPFLKEVYAAYKDNPRFAFIGLSLDVEAEAAKKYAAENELGWIQGFLGDWSKTTLPTQYGVEGIPSIFLIDPEGKLAAKDLREKGIMAAVESALK